MNESTSLSYEREGDLLRVRFPEYETAEEVHPLVEAAFRMVTETGVSRILIDTTANHISLSPLDYRRVGQYIERRPGVKEVSIAAVRRPELVPEARQLEHRLSEKGVRYRVFSDFAEAEEWLRRAPAPTPET